jgi:RimJ/RimL family protein N-acetyltransferase
VTDLVVRRVTPADGAVLRDVRLLALQDAPSAFGSTYAAEVTRSDAEWDDRAASGAAGADRFTALALVGDECVGLAGGFRNDDDGHHADIDLVSMWVGAAYRGSGVAERLVDAVLDWARDEAQAQVVGLWVTRGNDRAQRFYEREGFVETGDVQPLPSDPCKDEVRMVFGLRAPPTAGD